ncbi:hypothetical protein BDZ89DRAFT_1130939 [Hymenopellis radicata]|nr:hypothetical protein BDZ89DRAFT_1130939 [Hymenopellis radicata]
MFTLRRNDMRLDIDHVCPFTRRTSTRDISPSLSQATADPFRPFQLDLPLHGNSQADQDAYTASSAVSYPQLPAPDISPAAPPQHITTPPDPFKQGPFVTRSLLDEAWRIIRCARSDDTEYESLLIPSDRKHLTSSITHLRVEECARPVAFSVLSHVLPQLAILEVRGGIIRRAQTATFRAPKLRGLVIWSCKFDVLGVGAMLTGSPHLTSLAIGGMPADNQSWYLPGRGVPAPRFGRSLRWLFLDITRPALSNHARIWARNTRGQIPLHTLRVVLGECAVITFLDLIGIFKDSLEVLDLYCKENKWDIDPYDPILLCFESMLNIQRIRLTFYHTLLTDLVVNLRDMGRAACNLRCINLAVIFDEQQANLSILDELDGAFDHGRYPALELVSFTMVLDLDDEMYDSDYPDAVDLFKNTYLPVVRKCLTSINSKGLLEIKVQDLSIHERSFLEPRVPKCTNGL